jgi:hypothetical protein
MLNALISIRYALFVVIVLANAFRISNIYFRESIFIHAVHARNQLFLKELVRTFNPKKVNTQFRGCTCDIRSTCYNRGGRAF